MVKLVFFFLISKCLLYLHSRALGEMLTYFRAFINWVTLMPTLLGLKCVWHTEVNGN